MSIRGSLDGFRDKMRSKERDYPIEIKLLRFFVIGEEIWAAFNMIMSYIYHMPSAMAHMYTALTFGLFAYWMIAYLFKMNKVFINLYFVVYLLTLPVIWHCAGGVMASANILFVCEMVLFVMCLNGKRQIIYIILSLMSSSVITAASRALPPLQLSDIQIAAASRHIGMSTSLLIAALLIKQKKEYALERDAAIRSEKELEKSNQLQKNFLANMSHEIRSPLGIVMGFNSLIADCNSIEQIHDYSANITKAGRTLNTVINDILDYSKIESGKLDIIEVDYSYKELIAEIRDEIELKCAEKGLNFVLNSDEGIPDYLRGDNIRINQCLLNVLSNAVKYTDKGSVIFNARIEKGTREGCTINFEIKDTGRGMRPETMQNLFDAFQRLDEGHNRGIEGTGLGLAITKNLLNEMGGTIDVSSEYGKGSCFVLHIFQKKGVRPEGAMESKPEATDISGLKILAVDDTSLNLVLINRILSEQGVITTMIDNGKDCLTLCKRNKYDVILLDHMMPEMDGVEVFNRLKSEENLNSDTPVIMLTANAMTGAGKEYLDKGFCGYVSKPISFEALKAEIGRVVIRC